MYIDEYHRQLPVVSVFFLLLISHKFQPQDEFLSASSESKASEEDDNYAVSILTNKSSH
jgi:hypothetical protein